MHDGAASGGTERLRRPPRTYVGPPNRLITISDLSGYAKRRRGLAGQATAMRDHPLWRRSYPDDLEQLRTLLASEGALVDYCGPG